MVEQAHGLILLFDSSMKSLLHQCNFLRSPHYPTNKTCFTFFANYNVQWQQAEGEAERVIVSTALCVSNPVLVVATDAEGEAWLPVSTFLIYRRRSELLKPT